MSSSFWNDNVFKVLLDDDLATSESTLSTGDFAQDACTLHATSRVGTNVGTSHENGPLDAPFPTLHDGQVSLDGYLEPPPKAARISNGEPALEPKTLTPQMLMMPMNGSPVISLDAERLGSGGLVSRSDFVPTYNMNSMARSGSDAGGFFGSQGVGSPPVEDAHREKNRSAQRRFRQRQKERMRDSQQQLEELTKRLEEVMLEKSDLENRARILQEVMQYRDDHIDKLEMNQTVRDIEMELLLTDFATLMGKVEQREVSPAEARSITMEQWKYITRLRALLPVAWKHPDSPEAKELSDLIRMRRDQETKGALFTSLYWALFSWNYYSTREVPQTQWPTSQTWSRILAGLRLSPDQEKELLAARRRLISRLTAITSQRRATVSSLGLELLQCTKEELKDCPSAKALSKSIVAEHEAVFEFLYSVVDDILTPVQEAFLDTQTHPWWPDVWCLCNLLAAQRKQPPAPDFAELNVRAAPLEDLMPVITPFWWLTTPTHALGIGLRLKRAVLICGYWLQTPVSVDGNQWLSMPDIKELQNLTVYEASWGVFHNHWKKVLSSDGRVTAKVAAS